MARALCAWAIHVNRRGKNSVRNLRYGPRTQLVRGMYISHTFHFYQVQEPGLQEAYTQDRGTHKYLRKLMALPFLPAEKIQGRFNRLQQQATTEGLRKFASYVADNWVTSHTFPPATWSVYKETVRTNNDLEGWHNGLNRRDKGKSNQPLYVLIQLLHKEAALVSLKIRLESERRLRRHQRTTYRNMQKRLFSLQQQYEEGEKNSKQLLKACSHLVNPF